MKTIQSKAGIHFSRGGTIPPRNFEINNALEIKLKSHLYFTVVFYRKITILTKKREVKGR